MHYCSFHCFLDLTSSEILQEVLFLVVFLLPLPEEWKHYTTTCENERGIHGAGGLGHGSSEFLLSVVVPISALEGWGPRAGVAVFIGSEHPGMHGPLWEGWAVGRHRAAVRALGSLLSPQYSMLAEKLIGLRRFFAAVGKFLFSVNLPNTHIQLNKHPGGWASSLCVLRCFNTFWDLIWRCEMPVMFLHPGCTLASQHSLWWASANALNPALKLCW